MVWVADETHLSVISAGDLCLILLNTRESRAPHVPAINVCMKYRLKAKHATSVPHKVHFEVKAKASNPVT